VSLIAGIEGVLAAKQLDERHGIALVKVGGVTFQVRVPVLDLASLPEPGARVKLHTHLVVREDDLLLYGFTSERGRNMFEMVAGVSGVGPQAALAVLSVLTPSDLATAILASDERSISRAKGVGKRTAELIILHLKSKVEDDLGGLPLTATGGNVGSVDDPALAALLSLGFSALEARQALGVEKEDGLTVDDRIRRALQRIGGGA
jgi:Holliday junction DNA helicase RuvA